MRLCIVTGEASGDIHAAEVLKELRALDPSLEAFGFGGDSLAAEGVRILHHVSELGIVGLFNVLKHLSFFRRIFAQLLAEIERVRPDAVLLVDYPDFNLRIAKKVRALGIPVIYYISPQLWAWRKGRVRHIAENVDHMIVNFPFEETFYREHGVPVTYVGHPLVEQLGTIRRSPEGIDPHRPLRIALLPGSRRMEVASLLPPMLDAVARLRAGRSLDAFVVKAPTIDRASLESMVAGADVRVVDSGQRESIATADIAFASSGTATLEAAVIGVPVVVMYRLSRATYMLAKHLVKLPHFSLVNIVAGKKVVPELIQDEVHGEEIAREARELLEPARYAATLEELTRVREKLGEAGASRRAAEKIYRLVNEWRTAPRPR
jgi:lipid-A-disaccharide synthase